MPRASCEPCTTCRLCLQLVDFACNLCNLQLLQATGGLRVQLGTCATWGVYMQLGTSVCDLLLGTCACNLQLGRATWVVRVRYWLLCKPHLAQLGALALDLQRAHIGTFAVRNLQLGCAIWALVYARGVCKQTAPLATGCFGVQLVGATWDLCLQLATWTCNWGLALATWDFCLQLAACVCNLGFGVH